MVSGIDIIFFCLKTPTIYKFLKIIGTFLKLIT